MNILLIYPNINAQVGFNYGIASISAVLKQNGHQTKLLNLNEKLEEVPDYKQIIDTVKSFKPGLIGFFSCDAAIPICFKDRAKLIKASCDIPIVCGGIHATIAANEVLLEECFDYACVGEGEYSMLELVSVIEKDKKPQKIAGIWSKVNGKIVENPVNQFINITKLPRKDYEIFNLQNMINVETGWVRMMASRGCPFRCTYRLNHQVVNLYKKDTGLSQSKLNYTRRHSVDEVLSEIDFLLNNYKGINTIISYSYNDILGFYIASFNSSLTCFVISSSKSLALCLAILELNVLPDYQGYHPIIVRLLKLQPDYIMSRLPNISIFPSVNQNLPENKFI